MDVGIQMKYCQCGCGKTITRRYGEKSNDFRARKYDTHACYERSRKGKSGRRKTNMNHVPKNRKDTALFHPAIDKFLYGRLA